jgi:hypothetical protein
VKTLGSPETIGSWLAFARSALDGAQNARIGAAAADMPAHMRDDFVACRMRLSLQQIDRAHDLAGLTVATLRHALREPSLLHGMRRIGRKALDGRHVLAGDIRDLRLARKRAPTVNVHDAGAAEARAAAEFGAGEFEIFPNDPQQRRLGRRVDADRNTVHFELKGHVSTLFSRRIPDAEFCNNRLRVRAMITELLRQLRRAAPSLVSVFFCTDVRHKAHPALATELDEMPKCAQPRHDLSAQQVRSILPRC